MLVRTSYDANKPGVCDAVGIARGRDHHHVTTLNSVAVVGFKARPVPLWQRDFRVTLPEPIPKGAESLFYSENIEIWSADKIFQGWSMDVVDAPSSEHP